MSSNWDQLLKEVYNNKSIISENPYSHLVYGNKLCGMMFKSTDADKSRNVSLVHRLKSLENADVYFSAIKALFNDIYKNVENTAQAKRKADSVARGLVQKLINTQEDKLLAKTIKQELNTNLKNKGTPLPQVNYVSATEAGTMSQNVNSEESSQGSEITSIVSKIKTSISLKKILSPGDLGNELANYVTGITGYTLYNQTFSNQIGDTFGVDSFPAVISLLPIPHCQSIEVARSGKILKFRATGSTFLAHQEGGEDAIRIECLILPNLEYIVLLGLWLLFLAGKSRIQEVNKFINVSNLTDLRGKITSEFSNYNPNVEKPSYESHVTFPLVTRHVIIPNCYIETLAVNDNIYNGMDVLSVSILLRTYRPPDGFVKYDVSSSNSIMGRSDRSQSKVFEVIEYGANIIWRLINQQGWIIEEQEWKTRNNNASDDVYYDIELDSLVWSTVMGVMGIGLNIRNVRGLI